MDANRPTARGIIAHLYEYGAWAGERLLARAEMLSDTQLRQKLSIQSGIASGQGLLDGLMGFA